MEPKLEPKLGMLVESWARGFGRIVEIFAMGGFGVRFSYLSDPTETYYYMPEELGTVLKVHEEN